MVNTIFIHTLSIMKSWCYMESSDQYILSSVAHLRTYIPAVLMINGFCLHTTHTHTVKSVLYIYIALYNCILGHMPPYQPVILLFTASYIYTLDNWN